MKKNNKELVDFFYGEICLLLANLEKAMDEDDVEEIMGVYDYIYYRFSDLVEWGDDRFNLNKVSKKWKNHACTKDFYKFHTLICEDCEKEDFDYFMVQNEIWEKFGNGEGLLCMSCLEKRMGRKLKAEDFTDCVLNDESEEVKAIRKIYN